MITIPDHNFGDRYTWGVANHLMPELQLLQKKSLSQLQRKRMALKTAAELAPGEYRPYFYIFITAIKKLMQAKGALVFEPEAHTVTDHAFCRALERHYGFDLNKAKDIVRNDLEKNSPLIAIWRGQKIITYLPEVA